jgi:hypothetical protein
MASNGVSCGTTIPVSRIDPFWQMSRNTLGAGSVTLVLWEYRDFGDRIEGEDRRWGGSENGG